MPWLFPSAPAARQRGFGVVELMVVVAIIGLVFAGLYQLIVVTTRPIGSSARETEAVSLAEEAIEAVRVVRAESWSANIDSVTDGASYYPVIQNSNWTLSTTDPGLIDNLYSRTIVFDSVYRDANDNISTSGTLDPDTKLVTATVTWSERGQPQTVELQTYLTNFLEN